MSGPVTPGRLSKAEERDLQRKHDREMKELEGRVEGGMVGKVFGRGEQAKINQTGYAMLVSTGVAFGCIVLVVVLSILEAKATGSSWEKTIDRVMTILLISIGFLFGQRVSSPSPPVRKGGDE